MPSSSPATAFEAVFEADEHGHGPTCSTVGEAFEELVHDVVAMNCQIGASDWKARVHEGCRQKCLNSNSVRLKERRLCCYCWNNRRTCKDWERPIGARHCVSFSRLLRPAIDTSNCCAGEGGRGGECY